MASVGYLETLKAQAVAEAIERVEQLLDGPSEPLERARLDHQARSMAGFDAAALAAELARVVARQEERIAALEAAARGESAGEDAPAAAKK